MAEPAVAARNEKAARIVRRDGDTACTFPFGTYAMRAYHGAPVEPAPWPEARVARPGPVLVECWATGPVLGELRDHEPVTEQATVDADALTDAVREAVRLASAEIVEEDALDFTETAPVGRSVEEQFNAEGSAPTKRPAAAVRHRFDRQAGAGPSRLITLRDRRRGRPPSRSSADPPR